VFNNLVILIIGMVLLYGGSEFLVRGASNTALLLAIRPVIVGLTVVAFATSAPELLVSVVAAVEGAGGISLGNILGSNVINIALVLGISAVIKPVTIHKSIIRFELPYMLLSGLVFWLLCLDQKIGVMDGAILLTMLFLFLYISIRRARGENNGRQKNKSHSPRVHLTNAFMVVAGIIGLAKGADMVVSSAITMAREIGLTEAFIGLSVVAMGTSLPELATSAVAAGRGESDLSVGNVVGSNLFNICLVMGTVGLLNPMTIEKKILLVEFPPMILISFLLAGIALIKGKISRIMGLCFITYFIIYLTVSYLR